MLVYHRLLLALQTRDSVHGAYFMIEQGERGFGYKQKKTFLQLQKDADRKHLFCSK